MKPLALSLLASLVLSLGLPAAQASVLEPATTAAASATELYGVFHDAPTDFVFVKLPQGWVFAGRDGGERQHDVFVDPSTSFVYVRLSSGWKFVGIAQG